MTLRILISVTVPCVPLAEDSSGETLGQQEMHFRFLKGDKGHVITSIMVMSSPLTWSLSSKAQAKHVPTTLMRLNPTILTGSLLASLRHFS